MVASEITYQRLVQQRLIQQKFETPEDVVGRLGAVQSQEYSGAKWSLGMRLNNATDEALDQAFNDGAILRTHVLRPTWHFVLPDDIRWMLELTAPRVNAFCAYHYRQVELDDATFQQSNAVIADALQGNNFLTRAELGEVLAQNGVDTTNALRLAHIMLHAELDAVICSGPRRGKQFTYALLEERAPQARVLPRDEALAELVLRYYTGHGTATIKDFVWWSGLTVADAKAGLEMIGSRLNHEEIDGTTYWFAEMMPPAAAAASEAFLLPTYDELFVGFAEFDKARRGGRAPMGTGFYAPLVIDGRVLGTWRSSLKKRTMMIELEPFEPLTADEHDLLTIAAQRYSAFLKMPTALV